MEAPETRYVERPDGVSIAYQAFGSGERTIVFVPGFASHLDLSWTDPRLAAFLTRMATWGRIVTFDKPGTGLSDPIPHVPTIDERAEDIRIVMDAVDCERATLIGFSEGVSSSVMLAAMHPERVERLILYGGLAKGEPTDEELAETGLTRESVDRLWDLAERMISEWGTGRTLQLLSPSATSPLQRRMMGFYERAAASPGMARALIMAARGMDVLPVLGSVQAPTLLIHRTGEFTPVANSRLMARGIPGARLVELPGDDHAFWMNDPEPVLAEMERFLAVEGGAPEANRMLATVLFTDVVGSTRRAAELGDARWRAELEQLDALVRDRVREAGGRVVKSLGDGHLSTFGGPARAIRCALEVVERSELPLRAGIHTGECEVMGDDLGGLAVHIGARVGALAGEREVLVSGTVKDLVIGSPLTFADRGEHELKGVPGSWRLHAVGTPEAPPALPAERELRAGDRFALGAARRSPGRVGAVTGLVLRLGRSR